MPATAGISAHAHVLTSPHCTCHEATDHRPRHDRRTCSARRTAAIAKRYGAVVALRSASLAVRPGEVHALMGANGAGKSTLVKILTGAVRPDAGTDHVRGQPYAAHSPAEARRGGIVSVYQEPALIPDLDIRSNLRLTQTPPSSPSATGSRELGLPDLDLAQPRARPAARHRSGSSTSRGRWRSSRTC